MSEIKQNKQAGKTTYSGRRRDTTRKSGYKSHEEATGGKFKIEDCEEYTLKKGETLEITFSFPVTTDNYHFGFGLYYRVNASHTTSTSASGKQFLAVKLVKSCPCRPIQISSTSCKLAEANKYC